MPRQSSRARRETREDGNSARLSFGPFVVDRHLGELRRGDALIPLRPLATRALLLLVERPGQLVRREELRRALWGDLAVEWETGLHQVISQLRRALSDDSRIPEFIETVPRRGYRFKAAVGLEGSPLPSPPPVPSRPPASARRFHAWTFLGGMASTFALIALAVLLCCGLLV